MNKESQKPFTDASEKSAMHYQMRDKIILPIIRDLQSNNLAVISCQKDYGSRFTFTGCNKNGRLASTEVLELIIQNNGALSLTRYIPKRDGRKPVENMIVSPTLENTDSFMRLLRTVAFELSRFYDKTSILSYILYKDDPRGKYKQIALKPRL